MTEQSEQRVVFVTTTSLALWALFQSQIRYLARAGFDIHTVSSPGPELEECRRNTGVPMHELAIERRPSPAADLVSLVRLWRVFRRLRPAIVHTQLPKSGLLGMIAAAAAGVKIRIYTMNTLTLVTRTGWRRRLLRVADQLACRFATDVLCISHSMRRVAIEVGVCPEHKIRTLGHGSSHGVNLQRFDPDAFTPADRARIRKSFGIPLQALVLTFVGRIVREKGIEEVAIAWRQLREEFPDLRLLLCGCFEAEDPISHATMDFLQKDPRVHITNRFIADVATVYAITDIGLLPSYREGFGNVGIECAAMKVAVIASRIPGCTDSVQDGVTGMLVEAANPHALAQALRQLLANPCRRRELGEAGRAFVTSRFAEEHVSALIAGEYRRLLSATNSTPTLREANRSI